jgi:hypothetical protein
MYGNTQETRGVTVRQAIFGPVRLEEGRQVFVPRQNNGKSVVQLLLAKFVFRYPSVHVA